MLEILKKSSKTGDRLTAISDLQNNAERVYFKLGIGISVESFQSKFIVPRYLKYFVSRDKDTPAFLKAILEDFDLRGKLNFSKIP